jgi:hypothetical protein
MIRTRHRIGALRAQPPVYIAAPYAAPTAEERAANVARAVQLGRAVMAHWPNRPVIVPHLFGAGGLYGDATDDGGPSPARQLALHHCGLMAELVGAAGGWMVVVSAPDGSLSAGCELEVRRWFVGADSLPRGRAFGGSLIQQPFDVLLRLFTPSHVPESP